MKNAAASYVAYLAATIWPSSLSFFYPHPGDSLSWPMAMACVAFLCAVTWFAREILPRVERAVPEARFWIVGRQPQRAVRALARLPRVVVTGEVEDVSDWLCRAAVAVCFSILCYLVILSSLKIHLHCPEKNFHTQPWSVN